MMDKYTWFYTRKNKALLAQLNEAYEDQPTAEENKISKSMRNSHRKIIEQERW